MSQKIASEMKFTRMRQVHIDMTLLTVSGFILFLQIKALICVTAATKDECDVICNL